MRKNERLREGEGRVEIRNSCVTGERDRGREEINVMMQVNEQEKDMQNKEQEREKKIKKKDGED